MNAPANPAADAAALRLAALRLAALREIRTVVPFDAHVWLLTDPETTVGTRPLADVPPALLPRLPELIRLKYLTPTNRWTALHTEVATLDRTDSPWQALLRAHGVADVASAVFKDRYGCWGFLDLWRCGSPFTTAETTYLASLRAPLTTALRTCVARTFDHPAATVRGPLVLLLSQDLEVLGQTPETHEYLKVMVPPAEGRAPIPAGAYNVAAQLLAVEAGVDDHPPWARAHLSAGDWVTLRAARIGTGGIAVGIEQTSPSDRLGLFTRAVGLSARETELVTLLPGGAGTRELAARMHLSENTVQDHLKSIFTKTGTRTRRTLLARALGT
ncbi:LuxR C-terminal-related transcriptional regulator [Saccharothrix variisporea]|uniref:LuxR C-terminal-related transcriptional regulator n=1 Tax=Saccharothrix variisporea TaxID=543527 RepID=UPI001FE6BE12|nr:LuxR C-terminal-related transcriptional regulator [Saccharothrix variisporea]